jgi:hypothetical protein
LKLLWIELEPGQQNETPMFGHLAEEKRLVIFGKSGPDQRVFVLRGG